MTERNTRSCFTGSEHLWYGFAMKNETAQNIPDNAPLPMTKREMKARGIEQLDFVYIIGDAYIDHP